MAEPVTYEQYMNTETCTVRGERMADIDAAIKVKESEGWAAHGDLRYGIGEWYHEMIRVKAKE